MRRRPIVLIADDDRGTRELYVDYLRVAGYDVCDAKDGREATRKAAALRPDVIVLDLMMPGTDGWEALDAMVRKLALRGVRVIILTGHDLKDYLKPAALAVGAKSYLIKPCTPMRLASEVEAQLRTAWRERGATS